MEEVKTGFLRRLNPIIAGLTLLMAVCSAAFSGLFFAVGILAGGAFVIINTTLIAGLIRVTLADVRKPLDIFLAFCLKFPLLYGILVLLLSRHLIDPMGFAIGFTLLPVGFLAVAALDSINPSRTDHETSRGDNI